MEQHRITQLLNEMHASDATDEARFREALLREILDPLRNLARAKLLHESRHPKPDPTSLVHDSLLRMGSLKFADSKSLMGAAANAMRQVLIDRARKGGAKRGRDVHIDAVAELDWEAPALEQWDHPDMPVVAAALEQLAACDPLGADIATLKFSKGLSAREIATVLDMQPSDVEKHWRTALGLLRHEVAKSRKHASHPDTP